QEKNLGTWAIGKLNLYLHNMRAELERGDILVNPLHLDQDSIKNFDRVIANPPFSAKSWWTPIEVNRPKKVSKDGKAKEIPPNYKKELKDPYSRLG
ncbi:N-6 DNA methylase, partial [Sansalvadorimonas verongulae]|uniref:N-6 DNA methylase n=1 Tax=Sansalvadorimonas verongulae TaxID=2172824 RepID=UPI001E2F1576